MEPRKLKAIWTLETAQDLKSLHGYHMIWAEIDHAKEVSPYRITYSIVAYVLGTKNDNN